MPSKRVHNPEKIGSTDRLLMIIALMLSVIAVISVASYLALPVK